MTGEFNNELCTYIRAGYPIITIISAEEDRVIERVEDLLNDRERWKVRRPLYIWSVTRGFVDLDGNSLQNEHPSPENSLIFVEKYQEPALFLFKDFHTFLRDEYNNSRYVIRKIRDLVKDLCATGKCILWVTPVMYLPPELEKDVTIVELPFPREEEYENYLDSLIESVEENPKVMIDLDDEGKDLLIKACQGLTKSEVENALAKTIVGRGQLTGADVEAILKEKEQIIRKSGILEYTATVEDFGLIGGLGILKNWLKQRKRGFTQKARDFGLPYPRGVMLVGVPGCGKSLCAKAVAAEWQMPLLKFDLGRVFQSKVGQSEENMRKALAVAEGVAPAILWIDELEKSLAGTGGDGGVSARVFGNLLTWMEERQKPVFVVATGNDIDKLPPELLRKGRVDEIFFIDLPTPKERGEIVAIHIAKHNRDPADFDISSIVNATEDFTGSELEELVKSSLYEAFADEGKELRNEHLMKVAGEIIPLSRSRKEEIDKLRKWAEGNCRKAAESRDSLPLIEDVDSVAKRRGRMIDV